MSVGDVACIDALRDSWLGVIVGGVLGGIVGSILAALIKAAWNYARSGSPKGET